MEYILCIFLWIIIGWCICYKMDTGKAFINWLNEDPTGFLNIILMIAWPVFVYLMYKNKTH